MLRGRDQVLDALDELLAELRAYAAWENSTLETFLDAFAALLGSIENAYVNSGRPVPDDAWAVVADAVRGARFYE
ncbi:conserved hypothetical protein [Cellulomonas flavigena DSM 20109]|uniref:DUF7660 domain-containing protein n=1 Tax=Cellulomonas flavigena (strain ATCC 482 / DSM 20109 / BCRC 11376 / JCM 18109 / NBRC 3775 / NCIMB 8073 / NRS 134) TaxID=446466 RepID=D5UHP4_CELFN|nr:conserved hypothetical protein [Cellulomonas flavigena DSM 20109]